SEDWATLNISLDAAQSARPYSLYVYRNRILARMLAGREEDALALASKAASRGLTLNLTGHPAFEQLTALQAFAAIAEQMAQNAEPAGAPSNTVEFPRADLLPEAIAYDRKKNLYIGSVRTGEILSASHEGGALTPIAAAQAGIFDIEIRGDTIWAAVNNQLAYERADPDEPFASVMAFNKKTGAPMREIRATQPDALFGDLEVAKDGTLYVSDSTTPRIFSMAADGQNLEIYAEDPRFVNLQGIALDEKSRRLFVADYLGGLFVVNIQTGSVTALENDADAHLGGIDGLYFFQGDLIGVQNGSTPRRIVRIDLNEQATAVTSLTTLHSNLDGWTEPTHGAVLGNAFHYIATSNWPLYDETWAVREGVELAPLRIMTAPLESR
ncbi:MAG: hypothetical protein AAFW68_01955, partial [Pseudomonadota bacterium]